MLAFRESSDSEKRIRKRQIEIRDVSELKSAQAHQLCHALLILFFCFTSVLMSEARVEWEPSGPPQSGRGVKGQYVYWVCMAHPKPETVESLGVKVPGDYTRTV